MYNHQLAVNHIHFHIMKIYQMPISDATQLLISKAWPDLFALKISYISHIKATYRRSLVLTQVQAIIASLNIQNCTSLSTNCIKGYIYSHSLMFLQWNPFLTYIHCLFRRLNQILKTLGGHLYGLKGHWRRDVNVRGSVTVVNSRVWKKNLAGRKDITVHTLRIVFRLFFSLSL